LASKLGVELGAGLSGMNLDFSDAIQQKLVQYVELINHWNKAYNLTAVRNPTEMVSKHLLDSLSVFSFITGNNIIDVGSGAGLPGIPLAIVKPDTHFVLNDSNGKKTRFLTQARIELALDNVEVVNQRIEDYQPGIYFDAIISRAYADIDRFLSSTAHLQGKDTIIYIMQGKLDTVVSSPGYEIKDVHELNVEGLDAERHLIEICKAK